MKHVLLISAIAAGAAGVWLTAAQAANAPQAVVEVLNKAGYAQVGDVEMDDGLWKAEVGGADGRWHDLHLVPATGEIVDPKSGAPMQTAARIASSLEAAGYTRINELELDEALWDVDAVAPDGSKVELRINAFNGKILVTEVDD
jgi:uncharacterized membrane protein YkoI